MSNERELMHAAAVLLTAVETLFFRLIAELGKLQSRYVCVLWFHMIGFERFRGFAEWNSLWEEILDDKSRPIIVS